MFRGCAMNGRSLFGAAITVAALCSCVPVVCDAAGVSPGNVVVFRAGSGSNTLGNTGNNVFLDEYTMAGSLVQSIAINSTGTGTKLVVAGNSTAEGGLTISPDGQWIGFAGYASRCGSPQHHDGKLLADRDGHMVQWQQSAVCGLDGRQQDLCVGRRQRPRLWHG
jgi:hypothetical protein